MLKNKLYCESRKRHKDKAILAWIEGMSKTFNVT
jgi:hypothetical protein